MRQLGIAFGCALRQCLEGAARRYRGIAVLLQEYPHTAAATEMDRASRRVLRSGLPGKPFFEAAHQRCTSTYLVRSASRACIADLHPTADGPSDETVWGTGASDPHWSAAAEPGNHIVTDTTIKLAKPAISEHADSQQTVPPHLRTHTPIYPQQTLMA